MTTDQLDLEGFVDDAPIEQAAPPIIIDRSTLERWANCPHQAYHVDRGGIFTGSVDADVGNEVHAILSRAVAARREGEPAGRIRELIEELAMKSRPDIQPRVLAAAGRKWPLVSLLCNHDDGYGPERSPEDIIRFDGGPLGFEGQLAADLMPEAEDGSRGPIRLTCEVDLLMATASPEELSLYDWKSGWRHWTATDARTAFQFQFYAWVIFQNYPKVNRVRLVVWMTRDGEGTSAIYFDRHQMYEIGERLNAAVAVMLKHHNATQPEDVPAWPGPEKCSLCPAVTRCVLVHAPEADAAKDERGYLAQYVATQAAADRMSDVLATRVRSKGQDITYDGTAYGTGAPTTPRAKPCKLYAASKLGADGRIGA